MRAFNNMFKNLSIRAKLLVIFTVIFISGFIINFWVTTNKLRAEAEQAVVVEARELTMSLEKVRNGMAAIFTSDMYNMDELLRDPDKLFLAVPVVQALIVGAQLAEGSNYSFKAPAFDARNPDNNPTELEARLLTKMRKEGLATIWEIDEETNQLHFLRKVVLDETCMGCHGILEESLTGTMIDPLGYKMEGWRPGDVHGSFELIMPLDHIDAAINSAAITSAALISLIIAVGMAILYFLVNVFVNRPIQEVISLLADIDQGDGDLTKRVNIQSSDEIGEMGRLFDSFIAKIQDLMKKIKASSNQVEDASAQISSSSEQLAAGAEEQQAQLSEVATTMEQMSAMILEASKNASETRENAQNTGITAEKGREVVSRTVAGFETVANTVEQAAKQIQELSKRSDEIGGVIQVIDDIADQTNLLALNANIEAARAGDAGRGFAVVADEVRKLAERTVSATAEIGKMIESIQGDIQAAVTSMEMIQNQSKEGLELVAESDTSLQEISSSITAVVSAVEQIATASNEQSTGAEEISKNIEGVSTVAKESASSAQEMAASAEQLNNEVQTLNELIGEFKLE
ncbi:MAG: DUF3365 domain-containing protein [Candidatus Marinimicrobia bacterium]|nr:DUF3365 domain-containing protein [Candidatus Neomarinimicrobiota bacterium]